MNWPLPAPQDSSAPPASSASAADEREQPGGDRGDRQPRQQPARRSAGQARGSGGAQRARAPRRRGRRRAPGVMRAPRSTAAGERGGAVVVPGGVDEPAQRLPRVAVGLGERERADRLVAVRDPREQAQYSMSPR